MNNYKLRRVLATILIALGVLTILAWLVMICIDINNSFLKKYLIFVGLGVLFFGIIFFPYDVLKHYVKESEKKPIEIYDDPEENK